MTKPNRRPKPRRKLPPEVLSPDEVNALMAACRGDCYLAVRNCALIAVLYRSALRIAEALSLYPKDVDAERSSIRVLRGKGGRSRTVGIDAGGLEMLRPWLARRERMGFNGVLPLFCSARGKPLGTGYVRRMLPTLSRRAGIAKRVHAHGLRHTHAAELREEGVDIGVISKQLVHSDISTTARYLVEERLGALRRERLLMESRGEQLELLASRQAGVVDQVRELARFVEGMEFTLRHGTNVEKMGVLRGCVAEIGLASRPDSECALEVRDICGANLVRIRLETVSLAKGGDAKGVRRRSNMAT